MSERVVVDTDVISIVLKGHTSAANYAALLDGKQPVVSYGLFDFYILSKNRAETRTAN